MAVDYFRVNIIELLKERQDHWRDDTVTLRVEYFSFSMNTHLNPWPNIEFLFEVNSIAHENLW